MKTGISGLLLFVSLAGYAQMTGSVTQGPGTITHSDLMPGCPSNHITPLGTIISSDGKVWTVPADTRFFTGPFCADLYNGCNGVTPASLAAASTAQVPVTEIDAAGEVITGYLFADNYFELYVNGVLVGADPVPFTPFNSCVVKFRVSRPYTLAVKLVDWEENTGLGTEIQGANLYHPGDGGFIARFSDGTVTHAGWKAQTFYIAPVQNLNDVAELPDGTRSTSGSSLTPTCNSACYGVHYDEPAGWTSENFDDSGWPAARLYTAAQVTNQPAYTNFAATAWSGASFIWTSGLVSDNVVLTRFTVQETTARGLGQTTGSLGVWNEENCMLIAGPGTGGMAGTRIRVTSPAGRTFSPEADAWGRVSLRCLPPGIYLLTLQAGERFETSKIRIL